LAAKVKHLFKALQLLQKTGSKVINLCDKSLGIYSWSRKQFLIAAMGCFQKLMRMGRSRVSYHACFFFVQVRKMPIIPLHIALKRNLTSW